MAQYTDKDDVEEEWRDIDIYPQYQISNIGNVVRKKDGLLLKQYPQKSGYVYVVLDRGEGRHYVPIHRLVCIAFHGMDGYVKGLYVDHINTIRSDNRACNLRWVTAKENANNETTKLNRKRKRNVMKHYIDKDTLVAEIEKWQDGIKKGIFSIPLTGRDKAFAAFEYEVLGKIKDFLDTLEIKEIGVDLGDPKGDKSAKYIIDTKTLEVKEVDFEKELDLMITSAHIFHQASPPLMDVAKHFYELGVKTQKGE